MRRLCCAALLPLVLVIVGWGCSDDDSYGSGATSTPRSATQAAGQGTTAPGGESSLVSVQVADNSFSPGNLTIPAGTKVTWTWTGQNSHSVTGSFAGTKVESAVQKQGTFAFTFDKPGAFDYQCGVHGAAMAARVTVK